MQKLLRTIRILNSQFRILSFSEFFSFSTKSLFKLDRILVYIKELDDKVDLTVHSDLNTYIKKGELHELENVRKNMISPPWEFSCHLYDEVKDFFIFKKNGMISHISWVYYENNPNRIIDLGIDEGEIKYSLTLQAYRGTGIYPATLVKIQKHLTEKGYKRVFICVKEDNASSIKGIEKAGFKLISKIKLRKIVGIQLNKKFSYNIRGEE